MGWRTTVAVNLSAEDLRDVELGERVARALEAEGVSSRPARGSR